MRPFSLRRTSPLGTVEQFKGCSSMLQALILKASSTPPERNKLTFKGGEGPAKEIGPVGLGGLKVWLGVDSVDIRIVDV